MAFVYFSIITTSNFNHPSICFINIRVMFTKEKENPAMYCKSCVVLNHHSSQVLTKYHVATKISI